MLARHNQTKLLLLSLTKSHENHCKRLHSQPDVKHGMSIGESTRQVFVSTSTNIYTNLALEDWIYKNIDPGQKQFLLLWRNEPCVVIGRHQNPWTEANVPYLRESSINLARRNSGGGTVYHDLGNLNCTFFSSRSEYNRRKNLNLVCEAIRKVSHLNITVNSRDDIVLDETLKISGTASKLAHSKAYHHCTVLVDVDETNLRACLHSKVNGIESSATQSVRAPVKNLCQADPTFCIDRLQEALIWGFIQSDSNNKQKPPLHDKNKFKTVKPVADYFPGIRELQEEFKSNQWIFGKTPKFKLSRRFQLDEIVSKEICTPTLPELEISIVVQKGMVESVEVLLPFGVLDEELDLSSIMKDQVFGPGLIDSVYNALIKKEVSEAKVNFLTGCVSNMVKDFV